MSGFYKSNYVLMYLVFSTCTVKCTYNMWPPVQKPSLFVYFTQLYKYSFKVLIGTLIKLGAPSFLKFFCAAVCLWCVCVCVCVCVRECVYVLKHVKWSLHNQFNKLHYLWFVYTAPTIDLIQGCGLSTETYLEFLSKKVRLYYSFV